MTLSHHGSAGWFWKGRWNVSCKLISSWRDHATLDNSLSTKKQKCWKKIWISKGTNDNNIYNTIFLLTELMRAVILIIIDENYRELRNARLFQRRELGHHRKNLPFCRVHICVFAKNTSSEKKKDSETNDKSNLNWIHHSRFFFTFCKKQVLKKQSNFEQKIVKPRGLMKRKTKCWKIEIGDENIPNRNATQFWN